MSHYLANKGFIALFAFLAVFHAAWASYEWWWLFNLDRSVLPDGWLQFKVRWTAPLLTTLAMSAATMSYMVLRAPSGAMVMGMWFLYVALLCHLVLMYFDPGRNQEAVGHWIPVIALGILAYKVTKRVSLSNSD
ncbi:MAG: hypothetical protein MI867_03515 [Pseudomonadales bacterium]|nr:hypothetical protein [Pseudomonadales bacterium]